MNTRYVWVVWLCIVFGYAYYLYKYGEKIAPQKQKVINIIFLAIALQIFSQTNLYITRSESEKKLKENFQELGATLVGNIANGKLSTDLKETANAIALIHQNTFGSIPQEAEKAADDLLSALPQTKQQLKALSEKKGQEADLLRIRLKPILSYTIQYLDELILVLQKHGQNIQVERMEELPAIDSDTAKQYEVRKLVFPNQKVLVVSFVPAEIRNGVLVTYPSIGFKGPVDETGNYSFLVRADRAYTGGFTLNGAPPKPIVDISYPTETDPISDEGFRKAMSKNLSDLIKTIMALP